jgi:hypothetical protein
VGSATETSAEAGLSGTAAGVPAMVLDDLAVLPRRRRLLVGGMESGTCASASGDSAAGDGTGMSRGVSVYSEVVGETS